MSKLIIQLPDGEERTVPLRSGETSTVGRHSRQNIVLDDGTVSRLHAQLTWRDDGTCVLEDLRSSNGTTLNGTRTVRPEPLQDGDRLSFGKVGAIYLAEDTLQTVVYACAVGDRFAGRYQLEKLLGETDEYETFRATDTAAGNVPVSVTIYLPQTIAGAGGFEEVRQQFARVRAVPPHPGLVPLLDFARWRGSEYLVSEWVEGRTLLDLLRRRGMVPLAGALRLAGQVAAATDHARTHGWPAPDLSPRAVLLTTDEPLPPAEWEQMLDAPAERWPAFTLKVIPRLFAVPGEAVWPLGALLCELLGHPPTGRGVRSPVRIAYLGERGNAILARGFDAGSEGGGGDADFIAELAEAVGLSEKAS